MIPANRRKLDAIAAVLGYELHWGSKLGWPLKPNGDDTLLWSKDKKTEKEVQWKPEVDDGDSFKLSLALNIHVQLNTETNVAIASFVNLIGNPNGLSSYVSGYYGDEDPMPVVRRIVLDAAYEIARGRLIKQHQN